jgi:hypothetical protein
MITGNNSGYYNNDSPKKDFITTPNSRKKPASSDHQLMLSLLNREIPQDQLMMLAFASRESYKGFDNNEGIKVKGAYSQDAINSRVKSKYSHFIAEDKNAVAISLMPN